MIAYLHWVCDMPPLYSSVSEMDPETAAVFLYLLREDRPSNANATAADLAEHLNKIRERLH